MDDDKMQHVVIEPIENAGSFLNNVELFRTPRTPSGRIILPNFYKDSGEPFTYSNSSKVAKYRQD